MNDVPPLIALTLSGVMAAIANVALGDSTVALPRVMDGRLRLGFIAQVLLCVSVAHVVDHNYQTAFVAALCGNATLRQVKRRVDAAFQKVVDEFDEPTWSPPGGGGGPA